MNGVRPYRPPRRCGGTPPQRGMGACVLKFPIPLWGGVANTRNKVAIVFDGVVCCNGQLRGITTKHTKITKYLYMVFCKNIFSCLFVVFVVVKMFIVNRTLLIVQAPALFRKEGALARAGVFPLIALSVGVSGQTTPSNTIATLLRVFATPPQRGIGNYSMQAPALFGKEGALARAGVFPLVSPQRRVFFPSHTFIFLLSSSML